MTFVPQIAFRNMDASPAAEALVRQRVQALQHAAPRIGACRVVLDCAHRQNHVGRLYHVRIELMMPGGSIVVNRDGSNHAHDDLQVAIRDSFDIAWKRLQAFKAGPARRGWDARAAAEGMGE